MIEALANFLVRRRRLLMAVALGLTILSIPVAGRLELNRSIESLYAPDDPLLRDYLASKRIFGGDEFVIVAWEQPNLIRRDGMLSRPAAENIRELSNRLSRVGGVNRASTQDLARVIDDAVQFAQETAEKKFGESRIMRAIARRMALERQDDALEFSRGILIGADNRTTAIVLRLLPEEESPISRDETFRRIREIAAEHEYPTYVAGEPIQVHDAFDYVERDGRVLFLFSLGLLGAVLLILFRSIRWVVLPLLVTASSVLWTRAILWLFGAQLSMVSSMLNSIVTIVAVATITHIAVRYRKLRRERERFDALPRTYVELLVPIFWTTATTAAGFLSLTTSEVVPVRSFGLMTALGAALVFVAAIMLTPQGTVIWASARKTGPHGDHGRPSALARGLVSLTGLALRWRWTILMLAGGLMAFSAYGMSKSQVETDFSKNFRADSPIVQSLNFIETHLGGAGTWEVNFAAPESLTNEYLEKVRRLAGELRALKVDGEPALTKVIAITDGLDLLPSGMTVEDPNENLKLITKLQPEFVSTLYNPGAKRMRIVLRSEERQSAARKQEIIEGVEQAARQTFPEARTTGLFVLLTYLIESLLRDQLVSFSIAGAAIVLMMFAAFRRPWFAVVALVPNILPILVLLGMMGWFGIPVNIGTAMIASVSVGLTIDSSIHYFTSYRRAREAGMGVEEALRDTGRHVGVALVFATVALSAGFSVLSVSNFVPLIYFGVLVSLAMLGGLLGNLLLLPALVPRKDG